MDALLTWYMPCITHPSLLGCFSEQLDGVMSNLRQSLCDAKGSAKAAVASLQDAEGAVQQVREFCPITVQSLVLCVFCCLRRYIAVVRTPLLRYFMIAPK